MIYFDTSALVKLVFDEAESAALAEWLTLRTDLPKITSDLATIELLRTCRRVDEYTVEAANLLLGGIDLLLMDRAMPLRHSTQKFPQLSPHILVGQSLYYLLARPLSCRNNNLFPVITSPAITWVNSRSTLSQKCRKNY